MTVIPLTNERDTQLLTAAERLLKADGHLPEGATLSRVEVNGGLRDHESGYLYLRYDVPGTVSQEFWAHYGTRDHVAWKSGQISVKQTK